MTKLVTVARAEADGAVLTKAQQRTLFKDVVALVDAGRTEAERAAERLALETYWRVGRRLVEAKLTERAGYGSAVLEELAREAKIDPRTLRHALQLARLYPRKVNPALSWSQYRELIRLQDAGERAYYEQLAAENGWKRRELTAAIADDLFARRDAENEATPTRPKVIKLARPTEADYLYRVEPQRVIDGDTLDVELDLGFDVLRRHRLRLAHVDAPEKGSAEATATTRYVIERLAASTFVVMETVRVDLHGRYVAHVFYSTRDDETPSKAQVYRRGHYLNQELITRGLAMPVLTRAEPPWTTGRVRGCCSAGEGGGAGVV
jgi:endonuclease YncB( thermonuclease family)